MWLDLGTISFVKVDFETFLFIKLENDLFWVS